MFEEIYDKINNYRNRNLKWMFVFGFINTIIVIYFFYQEIHDKLTSTISTLLILPIVFDILIWSIIILTSSKKVKEIVRNELMPYILHNVNPNWELTNEEFKKEEELDSLLISKYGSFKTLKKVIGKEDDLSYAFSYVVNIISTGKSSTDVFTGTYITINSPFQYEGIVQVRDKGRPSKYKKLNLVCIKYDSKITEAFKDIKFFTNNPKLADELITYNFIQFYLGLKRNYKKGFYLSIVNNKIVLGIHNRKDYFNFGLFERVNQDKINQRIEDFQNLDRVIHDTYQYFKLNEKG